MINNISKIFITVSLCVMFLLTINAAYVTNYTHGFMDSLPGTVKYGKLAVKCDPNQVTVQIAEKNYYEGTVDLHQGYAMCHPYNDTDVFDSSPRYGHEVVAPATANLQFFAGVVAETYTRTSAVDSGVWVLKSGFTNKCLVDETFPVGTILGPVDAVYSLTRLTSTGDTWLASLGGYVIAGRGFASNGDTGYIKAVSKCLR